MSKFYLPTQKGLELFPTSVVAPPVIRWVGVDPRTSDGQAILDTFGSAITSFHMQQAHNHSLSVNNQSRSYRQIAPNIGVEYVNQGGIEYITIDVKPVKYETEEEPETVQKVEGDPLCMLVVCDGNKIAAVPMSQLVEGRFTPVLSKFSEVSNIGQNVHMQIKPSEAWPGVHFSLVAFSDGVLQDAASVFHLTNPRTLTGVVTACPSYAAGGALLSGSNGTIYTPIASYDQIPEAPYFQLNQDFSADFGYTTPSAISPTGDYYFAVSASTVYTYTLYVLAGSSFGLPPVLANRLLELEDELGNIFVIAASSYGVMGSSQEVFASFATSDNDLNTLQDQFSMVFPYNVYSNNGVSDSVSIEYMDFYGVATNVLQGQEQVDVTEALVGGFYYYGISTTSTPAVDSGWNRIRLLSSLPSLDVPPLSLGTINMDTSEPDQRLSCSYGELSGNYEFLMHVSNGRHCLQGLRPTGSTKALFFLDGVDVTTSMLADLDANTICMVMMDVPLSVISNLR